MNIGDVVDSKYELVRLMGEGGMGSVFEGQHVEIGRRVALKFLLPEVSGNPELVSRFLREAQAAAAVGSDHVVDVYDVGRLPDGAPYLVMEYLEGQTLADVISGESRVDIHTAVAIAIQLCEALTPVHERGIVHRDVKPANLFLTSLAGREGWLKVLDFGIAKVKSGVKGQTSSQLTRTGTTMGTPYYMAPEQFMGAKDVDGRADVYSAGVILYQMLVGDTPFTGDTYEELIVQVATGAVRPPADVQPDIDGALSDVVLRSMSREADSRFGSMDELSQALSPFGRAERASIIPLALAEPPAPEPTISVPPTRGAPGDDPRGRRGLSVDALRDGVLPHGNGGEALGDRVPLQPSGAVIPSLSLIRHSPRDEGDGGQAKGKWEQR